jgi:hypothetical protein
VGTIISSPKTRTILLALRIFLGVGGRPSVNRRHPTATKENMYDWIGKVTADPIVENFLNL